MNDQTCKNCQFWDDGICESPKLDWIGRGRKTKESNGFALRVYAADDHGLEGNLVTGPDFGCVHFSQKTT